MNGGHDKAPKASLQADGMDEAPRVCLMGIGNILWADEGFGVRAVELLHRKYVFDDNVQIVDGGTQGLNLLSFVEEADILVVFDAVDYGLEPGTLKIVEGDDVPAFLGAKKMSLHQTGFQEVLMLAQLRGSGPRELLLVGVQPLELEDYGGSLTEPVRRQLEPAVEVALEWLAQHGVQARVRLQAPQEEDIMPAGVRFETYEQGRPAPEEAPRLGDPRILQDPSIRFDPKYLLDDDARRLKVRLDGQREE